MLKLEGVKFPIKFISLSRGEITFTSEDKGVWDSGAVSMHNLELFIARHNELNPENSLNKAYYYIMSEGQDSYSMHDCWKVEASKLKVAKPEVKPMLRYTQIENMPIVATLKGVQLDSESWLEIAAEPKVIEVGDNAVTLILHHGGIGNETENCRISVKRGTLVRYEVE